MSHRASARVAAGVATMCLAAASVWGAGAERDLADPLNSPGWPQMRARFFKGQRIVFDDHVLVTAPANAEDPLDVPVFVNAAGLADVREVMVIADLNPIQKVLELTPVRAAPRLGFRFKVEQSTPIRAAALTPDGVWHVGGAWLSAAGGGCTTPSGASRGAFQGQVGAMTGRLWPRVGSAERLRLRIVHPMDTGLAGAIPAFYIDRLTVRDATGGELAMLRTFEPVAENPVFSLDLETQGAVSVDGSDIQGNHFSGWIAP